MYVPGGRWKSRTGSNKVVQDYFLWREGGGSAFFTETCTVATFIE